jgi:hypothetical protein
MRLRHLIAERKTILSDSNWRHDDLPPRLSGIYPKTRPMRAGWEWRSVVTGGSACQHIFLTQINEPRDNWKAWLVAMLNEGGSILCRFEYHGDHPGFHVHAHCERGGIETGPSTINGLVRIPGPHSAGAVTTLRRDAFWERARRHFRIDFPEGTLM